MSRQKSKTLLAIALAPDHEVRIAGSSSPCSLYFSGRIWAKVRLLLHGGPAAHNQAHLRQGFGAKHIATSA